jgi:hypothetical protein
MAITCSLVLYALNSLQMLSLIHGVCTYNNAKRPRHGLTGLWNLEFYLHEKGNL